MEIYETKHFGDITIGGVPATRVDIEPMWNMPIGKFSSEMPLAKYRHKPLIWGWYIDAWIRTVYSISDLFKYLFDDVGKVDVVIRRPGFPTLVIRNGQACAWDNLERRIQLVASCRYESYEGNMLAFIQIQQRGYDYADMVHNGADTDD